MRRVLALIRNSSVATANWCYVRSDCHVQRLYTSYTLSCKQNNCVEINQFCYQAVSAASTIVYYDRRSHHLHFGINIQRQ